MTEKATEKELDAAIERAFKESKEFADWFLSHTKFADLDAAYVWSRSDHPWGSIPFPVVNPDTGVEEIQNKESETDILVVFEDGSSSRFALHIENKIAGGSFTQYQPDMYVVRAAHWAGNPKYKGYTDFQTVLVAPQEFYKRNKEEADKFDCYISHEKISNHIPDFL